MSAGCRSRRARRSASASTARKCPRWTATTARAHNWTLTFADRVQTPPQPLVVIRNITDPAVRQCHRAARQARPAAPADRPRCRRHGAGGHGAAADRGFIKRQDFVELSLLESIHGVGGASDLRRCHSRGRADKVILGRPGGLTLSSADVAAERATAAVRPLFDVREWRKNQDEFCCAPGRADVATAAADDDQRTASAARPCQFLYVARHVSGGQGGQPTWCCAGQAAAPRIPRR